MSSKLNQDKKFECYPKNDFYSLNRVFGLGSKNNYSLSINNLNGIVAWVTGPYVVFYDFPDRVYIVGFTAVFFVAEQLPCVLEIQVVVPAVFFYPVIAIPGRQAKHIGEVYLACPGVADRLHVVQEFFEIEVCCLIFTVQDCLC